MPSKRHFIKSLHFPLMQYSYSRGICVLCLEIGPSFADAVTRNADYESSAMLNNAKSADHVSSQDYLANPKKLLVITAAKTENRMQEVAVEEEMATRTFACEL